MKVIERRCRYGKREIRRYNWAKIWEIDGGWESTISYYKIRVSCDDVELHLRLW